MELKSIVKRSFSSSAKFFRGLFGGHIPYIINHLEFNSNEFSFFDKTICLLLVFENWILFNRSLYICLFFIQNNYSTASFCLFIEIIVVLALKDTSQYFIDQGLCYNAIIRGQTMSDCSAIEISNVPIICTVT